MQTVLPNQCTKQISLEKKKNSNMEVSSMSAALIHFGKICKRKHAPPPHPRYVRLPLGCGRAGSNFQGSGYKAGSRWTSAAGYATSAPVGMALPSMYISGPTFRRNETNA